MRYTHPNCDQAVLYRKIKILGDRAQTSTDEGLFNHCFPGLQGFSKKWWKFVNHIKTDGFSASVIFSRPKSESGTANEEKVLNPSTGTFMDRG